MAGWPEASDVIARLADAGITATNPQAERYLADAITRFQEGTGWRPFVASDAATERKFTPPRDGVHVLDIGGAVEISAISLSGEALVEGEDWYPGPENADSDGEPWQTVEFYFSGYSERHVTGGPRSISISARWGYCADDAVPALAAQAVLGMACLLASAPIEAEDLGDTSTATVESVKVGEVETKYGASTAERGRTLRDARSGWQSAYDAALKRYKRITIV